MILYLFIFILLISNVTEKHTFSAFLQYCRTYISELQCQILKIKNQTNDLLCHQIKFKKVKEELVKSKKTGWFS